MRGVRRCQRVVVNGEESEATDVPRKTMEDGVGNSKTEGRAAPKLVEADERPGVASLRIFFVSASSST